ncbi:hypothetical protein VDGL01_11364, partial [Verticillium dahliae]
CQRSSAECTYATALPLGRPKRPRLDFTTPGPTGSDASQKTIPAPGSRDRTLSPPLGPSGQFPMCDALTFGPGDTGAETFPDNILDENRTTGTPPPSVWIPQARDTPSTALAGLLLGRPCACLATLYLILDELQQATELQFPSGLTLLRGWWEKIMAPLQCAICPQRYVTSVQNTQLISTVLISMTTNYRAILEAIDAETERSTQHSETKTWTLVQPASDAAGAGFSCQTVGYFVLDINPAEWRALARKTVKAEIFGVVDNKSRLYFLSLVDELEARQVRWHASPHCPDIPKACIHGPEKTPFCVLHCREARRQVRLLEL